MVNFTENFVKKIKKFNLVDLKFENKLWFMILLSVKLEIVFWCTEKFELDLKWW